MMRKIVMDSENHYFSISGVIDNAYQAARTPTAYPGYCTIRVVGDSRFFQFPVAVMQATVRLYIVGPDHGLEHALQYNTAVRTRRVVVSDVIIATYASSPRDAQRHVHVPAVGGARSGWCTEAI